MPLTKLQNLIKFEKRPRVLILGEHQHPDVVASLGFKYEWQMTGGFLVETYGFGKNPNRFDHWLPASDFSTRFSNEVYVEDDKRRDYGFDMVVLDLRNWMDHSWVNHDAIWQDTLRFLAPGGLAVVVGEALFHRALIGSFPYRLEQFHMFPETPRYGGPPIHHFMTGIRKTLGTASPNPKGKHLLACYLENYTQSSQKELFKFAASPAPMSLLEPVGLPYLVTRARSDDPLMMPSTFNLDYLAANLVGQPGPFEEIRKHLFHRGVQRTIRIPMRPTVGNLAKLATLADGPVVDGDGNWWVVKGVPETVHVEHKEENLSRDLKRLNLFGLQVTGEDKGTFIESQLG